MIPWTLNKGSNLDIRTLRLKPRAGLESKDRQEGALECPLTHGQRGLVWEDPSGAKRCFQREARVGEESKNAWSEGRRQPVHRHEEGLGGDRITCLGAKQIREVGEKQTARTPN